MLLSDNYLTVQELADKLRLSVSTLNTWRSRSKKGVQLGPPFVRVGGRIIYNVEAVEQWMAEQQDGAA